MADKSVIQTNGKGKGALEFSVPMPVNPDLSARERILQAAYEVIFEDQISGTRLRKIAERAGLANGHVHYYFSTKDELLLELLERLLLSFRQEREYLLADTSKSAMEKLLSVLALKVEVIQEGTKDFVVFDFWVQSASNEAIRENFSSSYSPWRDLIDQIIQSGIESGEFNPKYAGLLPSIIISIMDGAALQYLIDNQAFGLEEYFNTAGEMLSELLGIDE